MKLLVQGDDYGFTKGVTLGMLEGIDHGVLTCSGLFANMPDAEWAAAQMRARPDFCWGIDFNLVTGPCCADPRQIPHFVDAAGKRFSQQSNNLLGLRLPQQGHGLVELGDDLFFLVHIAAADVSNVVLVCPEAAANF